MRKNYYLILRLAPGATSKQIRSAYRRRALELHPDLTGLGSDQFLELQEAYDVLSDPVRRQIYDREAEDIPIRRVDAMRPPETVIPRRYRGEPLVADRSKRQPDDISLFGSFETFSPSLDEVFERLWSNFTFFTRPKAERLESLNLEVPLSPEQALVGGRGSHHGSGTTSLPGLPGPWEYRTLRVLALRRAWSSDGRISCEGKLSCGIAGGLSSAATSWPFRYSDFLSHRSISSDHFDMVRPVMPIVFSSVKIL